MTPAEYEIALRVRTQELERARAEIKGLKKDLNEAKDAATGTEKAVEGIGEKTTTSNRRAARSVKDLSEASIKAGADAIESRQKYNKALDAELARRGIVRKAIRDEQTATAALSAEETKRAALNRATHLQNEAAIKAQMAVLKQQKPELFQSVPDWAANANRARFQTFQLTSGLQDLAIVLQNGGTLDRALLGAANNLGVLASTASMPVAILGTLAVIAIPTFVKSLLEADHVLETVTQKMVRLNAESRRVAEQNIKLVQTFEKISEAKIALESGLGTREEVAAKRNLLDKIGEQAAEVFGKRPEEKSALKQKVLRDEVGKIMPAEEEGQKNYNAFRQGAADYARKLHEGMEPGAFQMTKKLYWLPDLQKLFKVTGQEDTGFWSIAKDIWGQSAANVMPRHERWRTQMQMQSLSEQAVKRAVELDKITELPKDLQPAAEAYKKQLEHYKKSPETRNAAIDAANERMKALTQGKDMTGLRRFAPDLHKEIIESAEEKERAEESFQLDIAARKRRIEEAREAADREPHGRTQWWQQRLIKQAEDQIRQLELEHKKDKLPLLPEDASRSFFQELMTPEEKNAAQNPSEFMRQVIPRQNEILRSQGVTFESMLEEQRRTNQLLQDILTNRNETRPEPNTNLQPGNGRPGGAGRN